jgi:hypothetical protein
MLSNDYNHVYYEDIEGFFGDGKGKHLGSYKGDFIEIKYGEGQPAYGSATGHGYGNYTGKSWTPRCAGGDGKEDMTGWDGSYQYEWEDSIKGWNGLS